MHDGIHAARLVELLHVGTAGRSQVAQVGGLHAHGVGDVEVDVDAALMGDGRQVQHGVGGAAQGHVHREGVLKSLLRHDVTRTNVALEHLHDGHARMLGQLQATRVHGGDGAVAAQAHTERLGEAVHGVGGVHARARTAGGADATRVVLHLLLGHVAGGVLALRLEHGGKARARAVHMTGEHGAARHKGRGDVEASGGHEQARNVLVAVRHHDKGVETMGERHGLGGVSDEVARDERVLHADMAHGDAVAHGDGREDDRGATGHGDAHLDGVDDLVDVHVAGNDLVVRAHDAHERAGDLLVGEAQCVVQRAMRPVHGAELDGIRLDVHRREPLPWQRYNLILYDAAIRRQFSEAYNRQIATWTPQHNPRFTPSKRHARVPGFLRAQFRSGAARKGPRFPSGAAPQRQSREDCLSTEGYLGPLGDNRPAEHLHPLRPLAPKRESHRGQHAKGPGLVQAQFRSGEAARTV